MKDKNIELVGKFYDNHSLSIVNRNIALGLVKAGYSVAITPLDGYDPSYNVDKKIVGILKSLESVDLGDEIDLQVRHTYPPVWRWPTNNKTKIAYIQPWEFNKTPSEWQYKFETFADALIVPSDYNKEAFLNGGINPNKVFTVANGYNPEVFNKEPGNDVSDLNIDKNKFNFVFVGNAQWRKGLEILLNVWSKTFSKADNARLIIKDNTAVYGKTNLLNELVKIQYKTDCAPITYIDEELSDIRMADIFKASKVLVHPYRAEGFGMHIQEAVACGCLPIVSDQGPVESFIPRDVGIRIPVSKQAINITDSKIFAMKPGDAMSNMGGHAFVNEPNPNELQKIIAYAYHGHSKDIFDKVTQFNNRNTWDNVTIDYINTFEQILNNPTIRRTHG